MSAFVLELDEFNGLFSWLEHRKPRLNDSEVYHIIRPYMTPKEFVKALYAANVEAVNQRYDEESDTDGYEPIYRTNLATLDRIEVYGILQCLLYQMAEGDVYESKIYNQAKRWYDSLAHDLVRAKYHDIPYGLSEERRKGGPISLLDMC